MADTFNENREAKGKHFGPVFISAVKEEGLQALEDAIYGAVTGHAPTADLSGIEGAAGGVNAEALGETISSARHKAALEQALESLTRMIEAMNFEAPMEIVALELRGALDRIGEITGETTTEDILEQIFSEFCIGK